MPAFKFNSLDEFMEGAGYIINGQWYPRVTSIVGIKAKPALLYYYAQAANFAQAQEMTTKSATEGTLVHNAIEAILKGEQPKVDSLIAPTVNAFHDFAQFHEIKPLTGGIEKRIWSPKHRFAGTIDILAEINGVFGILDVKTSSGIWRDYGLQTSAYMGALQEDDAWENLERKQVVTRWILRLDQQQVCLKCGAKRRTKGGNEKIRDNHNGCNHEWSETRGEWEFKELPDFKNDYEAFLGAKRLWEWENEFWLKKLGY